MEKEKLIKKFEEIAIEKNVEARRAGLRCTCGKCLLGKFSFKEVKEIIEKYGN